MYRIVSIYNQTLKSNIRTLKRAKNIIKDYTENYDLYTKEELKIVKQIKRRK